MGGYPWGSPLKFEENKTWQKSMVDFLIFLFCHCHTSSYPFMKKGYTPSHGYFNRQHDDLPLDLEGFPLNFHTQILHLLACPCSALTESQPLGPRARPQGMAPQSSRFDSPKMDVYMVYLYIHYIALASTFTISYIEFLREHLHIFTHYSICVQKPITPHSTSCQPFKASRHLRRWPLGTQLSWKRRPDTCNTT
jgi:hypothetical protein